MTQLEFDFEFIGKTVEMTEDEIRRVIESSPLLGYPEYSKVYRFMKRNGLDGIFMLGRNGREYKWFFNPKNPNGVSKYLTSRLHYFKTGA